MAETITYYVYTPSEDTPGLPCRVRETASGPDEGLDMETLQPDGTWKDAYQWLQPKFWSGDVDLDEIPADRVEAISKAWLNYVNREENNSKKGHAGR